MCRKLFELSWNIVSEYLTLDSFYYPINQLNNSQFLVGTLADSSLSG